MSQENQVKGDTKPEKESITQSKHENGLGSAQHASKAAQQVDEE